MKRRSKASSTPGTTPPKVRRARRARKYRDAAQAMFQLDARARLKDDAK